uniref:Neuralized E3 ubiquitin protein ligase 2 n=2 Tax=Phasianidae TaxID=9005 RepID=A0A8C9EMD1_PAVCR
MARGRGVGRPQPQQQRTQQRQHLREAQRRALPRARTRATNRTELHRPARARRPSLVPALPAQSQRDRSLLPRPAPRAARAAHPAPRSRSAPQHMTRAHMTSERSRVVGRGFAEGAGIALANRRAVSAADHAPPRRARTWERTGRPRHAPRSGAAAAPPGRGPCAWAHTAPGLSQCPARPAVTAGHCKRAQGGRPVRRIPEVGQGAGSSGEPRTPSLYGPVPHSPVGSTGHPSPPPSRGAPCTRTGLSRRLPAAAQRRAVKNSGAAMAAPGHPPTRFHRVHGSNVRLDASRTRATRVESFANALCFSHEPLAPGQIFLVEIEEKELGWCGHLRVGLTAHDPQSLGTVPEYSLPDLVGLGDTWVFAITRSHNRVSADGQEEPAPAPAPLWEPELRIEGVRIPRDKLVGRSRPGRYSHLLDELYRTNVLPPTALRSRIGVLYAPRPDGTADMHIVINGEDMGPSARSLPTARPLYAVVDVFASTKSVRVIQVEYGFPSLQTLCRLVIQKHVVHRLAIDGLDLPPMLKHFCQHE